MGQNEGPRYGWLENESELYRVAALRRELPFDTKVQDYTFHEGSTNLHEDGPIREVRLSELVKAGQPAVTYQFMYGRAQKKPFRCAAWWIDGFCGVARHLQPTMTFVVVAAAPTGDLRAWGAKREWDGLRLFSSADTSLKSDLHFEEPDGTQSPGVSVFTLDGKGELRHFYSVLAILGEKKYRSIDSCG